MKIILEFDITPMAIQSVRSTRRGHFYQPQKNIDYKTAIAYQAKCQLPNGFKIFTNAVIINKLVYMFPMLKLNDGCIIYKQTKPDLDNLSKGFFDALNGIVWQDDALIVCVRDVCKTYANCPGIILNVEEISKSRSY